MTRALPTLALPIVLIACGPSKAELAMQDCRTAFYSRQWRVAEAACLAAARLRPSDAVVAEMAATAIARSSKDGYDAILRGAADSTIPDSVRSRISAAVRVVDEERFRAEVPRPPDPIARALERQAAAAEQQARIADEEAFRRRLKEH